MATTFGTLNSLCILMLFFSILACFERNFVGAQAGQLPQEEKKAVEEIAQQLGKKDWDFNLNPCDENPNWYTTEQIKERPWYTNAVICNCSFPGGVCHVENISLTGQDLDGKLPPSLVKLPYIKTIELTRNYLHGTIPREWESTKLESMMLRRCNISGTIPDYIAKMPDLKRLDLSFNKLEGKVPNLEGLSQLQNVFLTSNFLTGPIPKWIESRSPKTRIDLSYNEMSDVPSTCEPTLNLFRSNSGGNNSELAPCLSHVPCRKDRYSVHINCGGSETTIGNKTFEADEDAAGPAYFHPSKAEWGMSSTGNFWRRNETMNVYTAKNISSLKMKDSDLYMNARLSPSSLTYYVRCLANGNYTVTLYFAEIMFRDNRSFQSLGRRMFDVYVQDERELKDFDIKHEAEGVDKAVNRIIKAVVKDKNLQIHFVYTGKGTTAVPIRGTYGPLVSAISVESDFKPPSKDVKSKIFIAVGVVVSGLCLIITFLGIAWWKGYLGGRMSREQENPR